MEEPIIIDAQLHQDNAYEPLQKTLEKIITKPEALKHYAKLIKHECEKHENCLDCPIFDRYRADLLQEPTCPFFNADNPSEWLVD